MNYSERMELYNHGRTSCVDIVIKECNIFMYPNLFPPSPEDVLNISKEWLDFQKNQSEGAVDPDMVNYWQNMVNSKNKRAYWVRQVARANPNQESALNKLALEILHSDSN